MKYSGNIERVLLVLISNSNADSERLLRMLRRSLGDDEVKLNIIEDSYVMFRHFAMFAIKPTQRTEAL